jgi:two-component system, cell cycle response regulator
MKPAVLIVDDDPSVVRMLQMGLAEDYEVVPVLDPAQTINIFHETTIDVVVSDIRMPGMSGFDILRSVKAANPLVEVILLTGELPDKSRPAVNALQSGAHDYLLKPVNLRGLKAAIQQALAKQRQQLEDKRKFQELLQRANTDFLTGLCNRHHFQSQVQLEFERSFRYERSLSCLLLDVDDFKKINDNFGHCAGDEVLQRLGQLFAKHLRSSDLKCRYGGEEFVVILPEADSEVASIVAEKMRRFIARESFEFAAPPLRITASIGMATSERRNFSSAEELIRAADLAMLQAKRDGRNCVRAHHPDTHSRIPNSSVVALYR